MVTANCGFQSPVGAKMIPSPAVFFFYNSKLLLYNGLVLARWLFQAWPRPFSTQHLTHPGPHLVPLVPNQGTSSQMKPPPILVG